MGLGLEGMENGVDGTVKKGEQRAFANVPNNEVINSVTQIECIESEYESFICFFIFTNSVL